jgi:hypothetical protein
MICSVCRTEFCAHCGMKWGFDPTIHNDVRSFTIAAEKFLAPDQ